MNNLLITATNIEKIALIGKGSFGEVFKCKWFLPGAGKFHYTVAVKYIPLSNTIAIEEAEKEVLHLSALEHENIVKVYGYFFDIHHIAIVTEFVEPMENMNSSSLYDLLRNNDTLLDSDFEFEIMIQAAKAVEALHSKNIIHRDIKSLNFLVGKDKKLKLCDFGLAKSIDVVTATSALSFKGTLLYMAPELLQPEQQFSFASDIYALAIVFFEIIEKDFPYDTKELLKQIVENKKRAFKRSQNPLLNSLIEKMWNDEASERPSIKKVITKLKSIQKEQKQKTPPKTANLPKLSPVNGIAPDHTTQQEYIPRRRKYGRRSSEDSLFPMGEDSFLLSSSMNKHNKRHLSCPSCCSLPDCSTNISDCFSNISDCCSQTCVNNHRLEETCLNCYTGETSNWTYGDSGSGGRLFLFVFLCGFVPLVGIHAQLLVHCCYFLKDRYENKYCLSIFLFLFQFTIVHALFSLLLLLAVNLLS